ncbi:MAG: glycosyltransferase [Lachnospiraceae bacterium]|nr:glycosyltransferase [Lachnospiraceae bacterium]
MISVIIPAYNAEQFIENTVASVFKQTYTAFEILIVNDGSTDRTKEICENLAGQHSQIRFFDKENSGVSATRNVALRHMKGDYVFFLDSDDVLPEYAFELLVREMERGGSQCDAVFGTHAYGYGEKRMPRVPRVESGEYTYDDFKDHFLDDGTLTGILFGSACGVLYRTNVIFEHEIYFHEKVLSNEDGLFNFMFLRAAEKIRVLASPYVYVYNQWKNNRTRPLDKDRKLINGEAYIESWMEREGIKEEFENQLLTRRVMIAFLNSIRVGDSKTNYRQARAFLKDEWSDPQVQRGFRHMNYEHMSKYKKLICMMMRRRMYLIFYLVIRYLYPFAGKVIKR